jgi:hypothetical protein
MKKLTFQLGLSLSKVQKHHLQLFLLVLTLVMLVLGAGAPVDGGGIGK